MPLVAKQEQTRTNVCLRLVDDRRRSSGAYRVYEDPADLLLRLDAIGVRADRAI
jgi:hypothetical protein